MPHSTEHTHRRYAAFETPSAIFQLSPTTDKIVVCAELCRTSYGAYTGVFGAGSEDSLVSASTRGTFHSSCMIATHIVHLLQNAGSVGIGGAPAQGPIPAGCGIGGATYIRENAGSVVHQRRDLYPLR